MAQKVFVSKGETNIIHSFVVIKVDPKQKIIYVAEASGQRGLVETAYHVNEFVKARTRFLIYQNKSEHFREIYATVAEKQIDKIINGLEQKNNLYSRQTYFSTPFPNIVYGPNAKKNLAEGCADFILNQPIKDSNNQRKSAICSSFAAMTFQIGQLYESIGSVELETLKQLDKPKITNYLLKKLDSSKELINNFFQQHAILEIDAEHIMPVTFHRILSQQVEQQK